jgi:RNA polymerase primary sigma factor
VTVGRATLIEDKIPAVKVLIDLGKSKGYLLFDEIYELLPDDVVSMPSDLDQIYQRFGDLEITIVDRPERYQNRSDIETIAGFDKKPDQGETEYVHAHEKTNDPVRMYLREMGTVPLLDRDGEVEIAQRIEQGEWTIYEALCNNAVVLRELLRLNELAQRDRKVLRELES